MVANEGEHVMLSYNWNSQNLVLAVHDILKAAGIKVWMDVNGGMQDNIYERYKYQQYFFVLDA